MFQLKNAIACLKPLFRMSPGLERVVARVEIYMMLERN